MNKHEIGIINTTSIVQIRSFFSFSSSEEHPTDDDSDNNDEDDDDDDRVPTRVTHVPSKRHVRINLIWIFYYKGLSRF